MTKREDQIERLEALIRDNQDELGQLHASLERLREAFDAAGVCECESCRRAVWIDGASLAVLCALLTKPHNLTRAEMLSNAIAWASELRAGLDKFHG